jgi:hypothetical protein
MDPKPDKECEKRGDIVLLSEIIANFSIYRNLGDIWFLIGDICNIKFRSPTTIYCAL